jgi:hypothetical protein
MMMTAATPKMMPSAVSTLRSKRRRRLLNARRMVSIRNCTKGPSVSRTLAMGSARRRSIVADQFAADQFAADQFAADQFGARRCWPCVGSA